MVNVYAIQLSFNNEAESFRIPVNPESLEIREKGQGKTYNIIQLGEINVIQHPQLAEISFESIFPARRYPFVTAESLQPPSYYVQTIERWMATKRPIRFRFAGPDYIINTPVSIESFEWKETAGATGDIEYKLSLKKYVFYAAKRVSAAASPQQPGQPALRQEPSPRPVERETPRTYTLQPGDSLWKVAKKLLGDGNRYREIQKLNGISDGDLRRLPVGMVIQIPQGR